MAAPLSSRLQSMLQAAVQSVQWTYGLFWQLCPQQGILVWGDGYYNGAIKTRKTVQPMEFSTVEASLQRSQQLIELYESLSAGETNPPTRRPSAALLPEDLTESEWFYLICVSFSFPPGVGLPGKAYARRQHVWLAGANDVDSKTFSRAILAKSARVQTVVCIPIRGGVVEFGTTNRVREDLNFIQHVKSFFMEHDAPPPKPVASEHSATSNPTSSYDLVSPPIPAAVDPPAESPNHHDDMDEEEEEEEVEALELDSEEETVRNGEARKVMEAEIMSEDIRVGSPDDESNNSDSDSDFHLVAVRVRQRQSRSGTGPGSGDLPVGLLQVEQPASAVPLPPSKDLTQGDTRSSQPVSRNLHNKSERWAQSPSVGYLTSSFQSAFAKWTRGAADNHLQVAADGTSQWLLKQILFTVPHFYANYHDENSPPTPDGNAGGDPVSRLRVNKGTLRYELSANHVLGERRRREKLNERFIILRSLVPFVTKMDKASILGDTIEYLKHLCKKIQDLEARNHQMEAEVLVQRTSSSSSKEQRRRKVRTVENGMTRRAKRVEAEASPPSVQVSIIEGDALLELECRQREGLLLDVMQMLKEARIEVIGVQSSLNDGVLMAELRAKVKENANGKKASIVEVKRVLKQIMPHHTHWLSHS